MSRMIVRNNEYCPECEAVNSLRKYASVVVHGHRRIYAKCKNCGAKVTIVYQDKPS